uniref:Uncharacterized protein n=1 Tax=Anguilla anguilla TaxID=7936 RepID=A0A0E9WMQ2_ANGAN
MHKNDACISSFVTCFKVLIEILPRMFMITIKVLWPLFANCLILCSSLYQILLLFPKYSLAILLRCRNVDSTGFLQSVSAYVIGNNKKP